jgi:hypothetical protein
MHGGLDDLPGQGVPAGPGNGAGVIEGEPERQVPALESFALFLLDPIGIGAVEEFLAQAAQRAGVQAGNPPPTQGASVSDILCAGAFRCPVPGVYP